uniref:Aquaporin-3 n=1 Tax=Phallusia mammillata TaxID=59560 RepID=A0A6F9D745_9ASCI|nr:aquaporin-3 [Phallusia mammillata]
MADREKEPMAEPVDRFTTFRRRIASLLRIENNLVREMLAEFLGTFILMVFGNGSVAQSVLSREAKGTFISINWAFGLGVTMAIYVTGSVSGAHINPAVSTALCLFGKLPLYKLPCYILSQVFGAFVSGAAVYSIYYDALNAFDGGVRQVLGPNGTGGIFCTYPADYLAITGGLWDQIFATAMLVGIVFAVTDERNNDVVGGLQPIIIGFVVFVLGLSYGVNCGYAINPARDFGPRLFTYFAGWGNAVFTEPGGMHWWWVPIVGPLIGGSLGAVIYKLVVGVHLPRKTRHDSEVIYAEESNNMVCDDYTDCTDQRPVLTKL